MPVYKVKSPNGERIVKATTKSVAINHVIRDTVTAEPMTGEEVADAAAAGTKIETAIVEPAPTMDAKVTRSADVQAMDAGKTKAA